MTISMIVANMLSFDTIKAPKVEFSSILETFKDSLAQERDVTQRFYNLSELARMIKIMLQFHF